MMYNGKSHSNGWWLGVPLFQETSICFHNPLHKILTWYPRKEHKSLKIHPSVDTFLVWNDIMWVTRCRKNHPPVLTMFFRSVVVFHHSQSWLVHYDCFTHIATIINQKNHHGSLLSLGYPLVTYHFFDHQTGRSRSLPTFITTNHH